MAFKKSLKQKRKAGVIEVMKSLNERLNKFDKMEFNGLFFKYLFDIKNWFKN